MSDSIHDAAASETDGSDRRLFLKKAGLMTAWAVPTLQVVNVAAARAQDVKTSVTTTTGGTRPTTTPTTQPECEPVRIERCVVPFGQDGAECGPIKLSVDWNDRGFCIGDLGPWDGAMVCIVFENGREVTVPIPSGGCWSIPALPVNQVVDTRPQIPSIRGIRVKALLCREQDPR